MPSEESDTTTISSYNIINPVLQEISFSMHFPVIKVISSKAYFSSFCSYHTLLSSILNDKKIQLLTSQITLEFV